MALDITLNQDGDTVELALKGEIDASTAPAFQQKVVEAAALEPARLVILAQDLAYMSSAGLRVLVFAKQKMSDEVAIHFVGATEPVRRTITMSGFDRAVYLDDTPPPRD